METFGEIHRNPSMHRLNLIELIKVADHLHFTGPLLRLNVGNPYDNSGPKTRGKASAIAPDGFNGPNPKL